MDTFRGRFGYAIDRFMIYGTAGVAVTGTDVTVSNPALFGTVTSSMQRTGWVVGLGGEFAVWSAGWADVTLKVEYLHARLRIQAVLRSAGRDQRDHHRDA